MDEEMDEVMEEMDTVLLYDEETDSQRELQLAGIYEDEDTDRNFYLLAEIWDDYDEAVAEFLGAEVDNDGDAYMFVDCAKADAEFMMTIDGKEIPVTTMMSDDEYNKAVDYFEQFGDFDIEVEGDEV